MQKKTPIKRLRHKAFKISWGVGTWNNPGGCRGTPQGRSRPPGSNPSAKGISRLRARPGQPLKGLPGPRGTFFFRQEASRSRRPWGGSSAAQRAPCRSVKGEGVVFYIPALYGPLEALHAIWGGQEYKISTPGLLAALDAAPAPLGPWQSVIAFCNLHLTSVEICRALSPGAGR